MCIRDSLRGNNSVMNINEVAQQAAIVLPVYDLQIRDPDGQVQPGDISVVKG